MGGWNTKSCVGDIFDRNVCCVVAVACLVILFFVERFLEDVQHMYPGILTIHLLVTVQQLSCYYGVDFD